MALAGKQNVLFADVFDVNVESSCARTIRSINIEDKAPECFYIEQKLRGMFSDLTISSSVAAAIAAARDEARVSVMQSMAVCILKER